MTFKVASLLCGIFALCSAGRAQNALVVDSSFAPLKVGPVDFDFKTCDVVSEKPVAMPPVGPCFDADLWNRFAEAARPTKGALFKGLMDSLAGLKSPAAQTYKSLVVKEAEKQAQLKNEFLLASHGTRSAYILAESSGFAAKIKPIRVTTSQAGTLSQSSVSGAEIPLYRSYDNGCDLRAYSNEELKAFRKGKLQPYQQRLDEILKSAPSIKVINMSMDYKRSWIAEDSPSCDAVQVNREFDVLKSTWRTLLRAHAGKLFFVAAGNEGSNFDESENGADDLWADLSSEPNLIVVGSLKMDGTRFPTSNYGKAVDAMVRGEKIAVKSPLPAMLEGHPTELRGTSFSTPLLSGKVLALWLKSPSLSPAEVLKLALAAP